MKKKKKGTWSRTIKTGMLLRRKLINTNGNLTQEKIVFECFDKLRADHISKLFKEIYNTEEMEKQDHFLFKKINQVP